MITCKNCNTQFSADYKYCPNCGKSNETTTCATCYAQIPTSADYCPKCSTPVTHTVKCAHCGAMNAKTSKFCGNCAKALKTEFDVAMDVERIKAVIPMLREALEAREVEPEPVPELTRKELKAKKKIEKIAKKAGFTLIDPDEEVEEVPELTAEDLIEVLPEPETECDCDCNCECDCCEDEVDPVVELLKAQNENLQKVIDKLSEEKAQQPAMPFYPFPMPMYQPAPAAEAAPAPQPIVIQQPAPAPAPQPIVIQQPAPAPAPQPQIIIQQADGTTSAVGAPVVDGKKSKKELKAEKKAAKKAKNAGKPKKHRLAGLFMLLFSAGYLAALWFLPMLIAPAANILPGEINGIDIARAIFVLGGDATAVITEGSALAPIIGGLTLDGLTEIKDIVVVIANYIACGLMTISVLFAAIDVVFSLFRVLTGKAKKRRGFFTRMSFLCYLAIPVMLLIRAASGSTDIATDLVAVVASFMDGGVDNFVVLGLGGVVAFAALLLRQFVNCFIKKSK